MAKKRDYTPEELLKELGLDYPDLVEAVKKADVQTGVLDTDGLAELKAKLWKQDALIKRLTAQTAPYGIVLFMAEDKAVISYEGRLLEVEKPSDKKIQPGDVVKLQPQTLQIVDLVNVSLPASVATVKQIPNTETCVVDFQGGQLVVLIGKHGKDLEIGDRVAIDKTGSVVIGKLGHEEESYEFSGDTNVAWNDIGGLDGAKKDLQEALELPFKYPELFKFHNQEPIKGVLLYGPPGCGKTMLVKAAANSLLGRMKNEAGQKSGFIYVKGPEVLDKYVGIAEGKIRKIFYIAKKFKGKTGYQAVIFIDEAESILNKRGSGQSSDIERTIVPAFLAEMDGLDVSGAVVLLATNRPDLLDPAITRDGRVDRKVRVERPDFATSKIIFRLYLDKVPIKDKSNDEMTTLAAAYLFSPEYALYEITRNSKGKETKEQFTLGQLASGAMIRGIVSKANSLALWRNIEQKTKEGITGEDIATAVKRTLKENWDLNHEDELEDFVRDFREEVPFGGIRKLKQATS